ncbi:acyl-CoA dehydrogenase family protein [Parahaliea mediterranea]|uniref:Acyl-CoA dehydrogenase family protein n=1 Tax=Parahaliea mediterranea TaxID=651086 RepID=A0A939DG87_9GAMM|nr:acyl-CoA dehydrogenase family protein [Parahaliea mediterranea]MBN7797503.1 acyl-CoA dehydrogenase family protein [Parahaliea mediterranea]
MNAELSSDDLDFQDEVRRFLGSELPDDIRGRVESGGRLSKEQHVRWQKVVYERGWAGVNWPRQYGGTGWTPVQKHIFEKECARAYAPEFISFGLKMVGPVIYTFGTDEQKQRFLPSILSSDTWWCQGYSEPNAGSDLVALTTTAVRRGDHYVVNGAKTWTTYAHRADWMFCLVRTGAADVKSQEAITFLLIDMTSPGITVSPIITLDGAHEVNEVFLNDVKVPVDNRIGEENKGWSYAKFLLNHERTNIAKVAISRQRLSQLKSLLLVTPDGLGGFLSDDPAFSRKLAELEIELKALEFTELRTLSALSTGESPGPQSSILKVCGTEVAQRIDELFVEAAGMAGLPYRPDHYLGNAEVDQAGCVESYVNRTPWYFNNRKASIYGGSNEIQKNIIAKTVLGI